MSSENSNLESLEELDDSTDCGSDYETSINIKKRKKRAVPGPRPPKRTRRKAASRVTSSPYNSSRPTPVDPSSKQQRSRGTSRPVSPRPASRGNEGNRDITAKDLYDAVSFGKSAMVAVVDEWLDSYKRSREMGLLVLINFIVQSCGCKGVVSREMLDSMQNAEIISTLTKEFNEDTVDYPLSSSGLQQKLFKAGLCEFARVLVRSCQNSIIYDEYLFNSLLSLLTGLSDSQVRAFRHTSTLLAMKLMTGVVEVAVTVQTQMQTTQRRYDVENSKRANDKATDRLEELQATITELLEKREELSSMMNVGFRGVFVHRYRDRLSEIRMACIDELGVWLKTNPEQFLNDGCLKYLGWTLNDKQSPVRLHCVRALQGLYQEMGFIGRLELFTSRFKERMLSMVLDKDPDVALEVVNLLLLIQQRTEEALTEEECGHIYPLVYASHRGLASAAGAFLYNKLKSVVSSKKQGSKTSENEAFFQILISFYIQSEFHEHGAYLVDSLWGVAGSELRDWDTMTAFLLHEAVLMDEEEGALIEVMMCAMRQAAQATPPVGRTQAKKIFSMKDKKIQEKDRRRITTHFIPLLSSLLAKYSADAGKMTALLKAPLYFNLDMYNSAQWLEKHLDQLLSQVCGIVEKHTDVAVLEACTNLAAALCSDAYTFSSRAHLAFSQLLDDLTECFNMHLCDLLQGTADDNDAYSAATALKRIAALSGAKDPTGWKLFDSCVKLLNSKLESRELDTELMVSALRCASFHLMWAKVNAVNSKPAEAELRNLKRDVRLFCGVCQSCLSLTQTEIRDQAFELLCDLLLLYSTSSVRSEPALQTLVHIPSDSLRSEMAAFLLDFVFTDLDDAEINVEGEEEMKIILLQRKRNQLAGYCKLVIYGVLDLTAATDIFKHFSKYFKDFGDIIKETVSKSKLINPVQSAKTVCLSLQQLFSEMLTEVYITQDLIEIRDVGKRLAMSFGIDLQRVRKPMVALHRDGIDFSFRDQQEGEQQLQNVVFLEILSEFSLKLLPQDRSMLAAYLKSVCPSAALSWPSVGVYQRSLETRSTRPREQEKGDAFSTHETPVAKRKKTTTRVSSGAKGSFLDSSSISSNIPTPALTSTMLKQPARQLTSRQLPTRARRATTSDVSSGITELESEDEFSAGSHMRRVKPVKRRSFTSNQTDPILNQPDLIPHVNLLSLIEDDEAESGDEAEIEEYESDSDHQSSYALPSTRHTSISVLDELFD
ncbi:cohesin subunit SA-1-like [Solea senegalensis]|uniref:Cohesin subunit SA n=1 Tax=Solea senegalensis TaxID=28829 RepID=A0AAV6SMZ5_SOLSE|nr:cohesin subunit SA-1 [Solea senegalensis]KAG7518889.1 cohesin subunit SA-1-like [Solea senegalensis]